ncbi:hypothetical protein TNCV_3741471 [Trichonephila clavipes]|nr:hypothetical protein TNCV_3741471 [Trichonephila clavipes]
MVSLCHPSLSPTDLGRFDEEETSPGWCSSPRPIVPIPVFVTLGVEVHVQMFRSSGQFDAKPPVFNSQASSVLIYRLTEGMKSSLLSPKFEPQICSVEA